jgi:hypothetical protein
MFNDDIMAFISIASTQNHLKMLLQIKEQVALPLDYSLYLDKIIQQEVQEYLDDFGGELKDLHV